MGLYLNSILDNTTMFFIFLNYLGMEYFYIKAKETVLSFVNNCVYYLGIIKIQQCNLLVFTYYYYSNFLNYIYLNVFSFLFILNFKFLFFIFYIILNNFNSFDFFDRVFDIGISNLNAYQSLDLLINAEFLKFVCFTNKIDFNLLSLLFFW
jgi:hypothetical protein